MSKVRAGSLNEVGKISRKGAKAQRKERTADWNMKPFAALRLGVRIILCDSVLARGSKVSKMAKMSKSEGAGRAVGWALLPVES